MKPKGIVIHHSLTEDGSTVSWSAIRDYHMNTQKWADIGYHYGIERVGLHYEILKGRMDNEEGAHCLGFNDWIGICLVGNFDILVPSDSQMQLLIKLCTSLMTTYGFKVDQVLGHCETYTRRKKPMQKTCPGLLVSMDSLRKKLREVK